MKRRLRKLTRLRRLRRLRSGGPSAPRRKLGRRSGAIVLIAVVALAAGALAFWSTSGSGSASGSVGSLAAPTGVGASSTTGSSNVSVTWTASKPLSGVSPTGYYVRRYVGSTPTVAGGNCGTPSAPVNQTSCTDAEVADGTYTYTVVAVYRTWTAESAHSSSVTVQGDATPPTTTLTTSPSSPEGTNGWFKKASIQFTLSAEDTGSGVASTHYMLDGGGTHTYSGAVTVSGEGEHTITYWSTDKAGNEESHHTANVKLDSVAPTNALSMGAANHALLSGSRLYFNSGLAGSFTLTNTVSDATSGPASASFPLVSAGGWTHAAQTVTTPSGGPYTSSTYSWGSGAGTPSGAEASIAGADSAGNATSTALSFVADTAAPTGGALSVNGTAASAGGSASASSSTSFTIGSRTDFSEPQGASQSGLASSTLTIQSETLTGNVCGAPGSGGKYASPTTIAGTSNPSIETGFCYLYTLAGTDNVGNAASVSTTVKVDTTGPSSPTVTLSSASGNTFISGTTAYINPQAGKSGSFKAAGASSDAQSGVATIEFPSLTGFSAGGGTLSSPFETTYEWSGAAGAAGTKSVTATNGTGVTTTNASAFTVTPDTTAPTGGVLAVNGTAASGGGTSSTSSSTSFAIGTRTNYAETQSASQSGLASSTLTIQSETLTGNVCGAPGSGGKYASPTTIAGTTNPTIETGFCYLYTLTGTDNVGNAASVSTTVKVDTTGPSSPTVTLSTATGNTFISGTSVFINPQAGKSGSFKATGASTDAQSGIASIKLPSLSGFSAGGGTLSSPFETTYEWSGAAGAAGAQSVTATNGSGLTATNASAFTVTSDTTAPSGGALSVNGTAASVAGTTSTSSSTSFAIGTRTNYSETQSASQSGLASSTLTIESETLTGNVCGAPGSGGPYTSATTVAGTTNPSIETGFCYLYTLTGTDNVGNAASVSTTVKVDTTGPSSPTVTLSSATGSTFISGTTVYINAQAGKEGSFKATGASTDAQTGVSSISLPSLTGFSEGGGTLSSPFETKYKWAGAVGASGAQSVTATNGSGLTATNASAFTVTSDTTAPSGGAVSVNGTAASAGGSTSTSTSTGFAIGSRTDYSETQSASQSGLASSTLTIQSETLTGNVCGAPGSGGPYTSATTVAGTTNPSIETGFCYLYTLTGTDNVGNATSVKTTVKVDTTGPSSPTVTLSSATGNTFISGTTVFINPQAGKEGSFKATGASTDAQTGVSSISLPSLTGFSEGGGTLGSPFETKYKWAGAVAASGAQSVTATNGVGLTTTNSSAFTVTPDTSAPSSAGTVTVPSRAHGAVEVSFSGAADAGSGISTAAGELLRAEATYTSATDSCGTFGSFAKVGSAGPTSPATDSTVATGKCYEYEYKASDNVGNTTTSSPSGAVKVETTAPKAEKIEAKNGTGATAHKTDAKDVVTYTFTKNIDPSTITSAWSAGSTPDQTVTLTFKDSGEGNGTNKPDSFEVTTAGVHLGSVEMSSGNWVPSKGGSYGFSSTMHFATVEGKTVITITLNSLNGGGSSVGTESSADTFKWTPDAAIADLFGNAVDTSTKAENKAEHF